MIWTELLVKVHLMNLGHEVSIKKKGLQHICEAKV